MRVFLVLALALVLGLSLQFPSVKWVSKYIWFLCLSTSSLTLGVFGPRRLRVPVNLDIPPTLIGSRSVDPRPS